MSHGVSSTPPSASHYTGSEINRTSGVGELRSPRWEPCEPIVLRSITRGLRFRHKQRHTTVPQAYAHGVGELAAALSKIAAASHLRHAKHREKGLDEVRG